MWSEIDSASSERAYGDMDLNEFNTVHKVNLAALLSSEHVTSCSFTLFNNNLQLVLQTSVHSHATHVVVVSSITAGKSEIRATLIFVFADLQVVE